MIIVQKRLGSSKNNNSQFLILITLHVLDSFDHQQVCMNKNNKYTKLKTVYMFRSEYMKIYYQCYIIIKIV
jgi:hypothetical protein